MDPRRNPYTPNAGARPPLLVGRDDQLETFDLLLARLLDGYAEQSMIITGLRGVGKTVLLNEFRIRAESADWAVVEVEVSKHDDSTFRRIMARESRRALFAIAPRAKWKAKAQRAAAALKSFTLTVSPDGSLSAGLDVDAIPGVADSGMLDADLTDLLVSLGEAAEDHATGVVFLLDEIQFLSVGQLESLIAAMHRTVQRSLPITLVAAGLPQIPELAGEAKSYAERLFKFPSIGKFSHDDAGEALVGPARDHDVIFATDATAVVVEYTDGYPYFIQEFGKAVWDCHRSAVRPVPEASSSPPCTPEANAQGALTEAAMQRIDPRRSRASLSPPSERSAARTTPATTGFPGGRRVAASPSAERK